MLTREGFVAADMSAPISLQRSSWKAEAIRKGNLKISGPIPIMEDTPLNEDEEKEFAETGALQSPSQPQDELEQLDARPKTPPRTPAQTELSPPIIPLAQRASLTSHPVDEQDVLLEAQTSRSPPRPRQLTEVARESVFEPTSPSQNGFRATPESASKLSQKKKRKSGLRNVFRKMFGRKDKDGIEEEPVQRGHSYHRSVSDFTCPASVKTDSNRTRACSNNHRRGRRKHQVGLGYLIYPLKSWNLSIRLEILYHIP
jgi:hypothetical protein